MLKFRKLNESVKETELGDLVCDYVGNVRDLLINKPADYRILYAPDDDLYFVGDAWGATHTSILDSAFEEGMLPKAESLIENSHIEDTVDYLLNRCKLFIFTPYTSKDSDPWDERRLYEYHNALHLTTGDLLTKTLPLKIYDEKLYNVLKPFIIEDKQLTEEVKDYGTGKIKCLA